jgi:signal transduction histidine kinase/DNA-binding NarL/FixJ family response regulator
MSDAAEPRELASLLGALRAKVDAASAPGASPEARAFAAELAPLVCEAEAALAAEQARRDEQEVHFGEVLEAVFAMAALDFTHRAPVRGDTPIDALANSLNMLAEELDAAQAHLVEATPAKAATAAKSRFLAHMSHEIRTPLTALLGFAEMLEAPALGESDRLNYAMIVRRNGAHLLSVINDILDLSKVEAGKLKLEILECALPALMADVSALMKGRAAERGLAYAVRVESPVPTKVRTDPTRLRQVLLNVVGNALKFTEKGGVTVSLGFDPARDRLRFSIADTGIGMTPEQLGRLFHAFEQADPSTTRRFGGSGLGLAVSRELVVALGGEIDVRSELGRGSTFVVSVPTGWAAGSELTTILLEAPRAAGAGPAADARFEGSVLFADDGPDNQILVATLLRKHGLEPVVVENGALARARALEAWRAGAPFDLVLMDMEMPVMDGYTATRELRAAGYRGPVVALTAHAMGEERAKCLSAGCDEYVRKPIDRAELASVLRRHLRAQGSVTPPPALAPVVSTFADDPDMAEIVDRFVASLPDRVAALRAEVAAGAAGRDALRRLAHQLKGGADGYGFPAITEAAAAVEGAVVSGATDASVAAAVEALAALTARVRPAAR